MMESSKSKRPDNYSLEMIIVLAIITLHDFLLSSTLSIPAALGRIALARLISLDRIESSLEFIVPMGVLAAMLMLWLTERDQWVHTLAIVYLAWVTIRLTAKVVLVSYIIASRPQLGVGVLLKDVIVLWIANILLFGAWYWIIDAGGPRVRREGPAQRFDFAFPQRVASLPGWQGWQPGFWDYVFLGFCGSTQFGLADTLVLSLRAKLLLMLQAALSVTVIVFIASIAISVLR
ncbi:MAG TPA: hypothetical protein VLX61_08550 [Anaerolineales bacterium]|nr:hypothetical protein [Anaerolineales bacterium]